VQLRAVRTVGLDMFVGFAPAHARPGQMVRGFAGLDELGRVVLQDPITHVVLVLDTDGRAVFRAAIAPLEPRFGTEVERVRALPDGGIALQTRAGIRLFGPDGRHVADEPKGAVAQFEVDEGVWLVLDAQLELVRTGNRARITVDRHADRRFFTALGGALREGERLVVLDNTSWDVGEKAWGGRVTRYTLDGRAIETRDLAVVPGARDPRLVSSATPWLLLCAASDFDDDASKAEWLARTDDGSVRSIAWPHDGRALGFSADGRGLWQLDEGGLEIRLHALPE
jgi:hypothetical protein